VFGFTFEKLILIAVLAAIVLGPTRLPRYAAKLAVAVKALRSLADTAKDRMRDEMGPEFDDVDWRKLDPRQYDPRKIIRDALLEDVDVPRVRLAGSETTTHEDTPVAVADLAPMPAEVESVQKE
jgi:sec-independent protein translocase protein TatB